MKTTRLSATCTGSVLSAAILAVLANMPTAHAQTTDTWSLGASGLWGVAGDWSAGVVPNNGTPSGATYNVDIIDGVSTVTLNINAGINDLAIGSGNTLLVEGGTTLTVAGPSISNKGAIQLNGGSGGNAILDVAGNVTLSGSGTLTLSSQAGGNGSAYIEQNASGVTLTTGGTVRGSGVIGNGGLTLVNTSKGVIDANASGTGIATQLTLNGSGGITNAGLLEATRGNTLLVETGVANANGNITASGTNSVVSLNGATVTGGTLNSSAGGSITAAGNTTLNAVTISAGSIVTTPANTATYLSGTMTNDGTIQVNGGAGSVADLVINTNVTLTGGGKVTLNTASGGGNVFVLQNGSGLTLTNSNNTIQGNALFGYGGLTVVNSAGGTISSDVSGGSLLLDGGGLTNSGTLQVSSGALLQVSSGPFTNFSGSTLTGGTYDVSGTLQVEELGTAGGEIVTDAANITLDGAAAKFVDEDGNSALTNLATIAAKSSFTVTGGADFTAAGNFTNKGTLSVGAGSVFDVHGRLTNFSSTTDTLTGGAYDVTGKLEFAGANIETNDASITLAGNSSEFLNTTTRKNGLANFATNEAAGKLTIASGATLSTAGSVSNAGTLTVGTGSTLTVGGPGVYTQSAGTTTDSGTLAAAGGVTLSGGSLFAGGTITGNLASSGIVTPGASATKTGILTDTGTYTQNSAGSLNIGIGGTTAGTTFSAVNSTTAVLGGTLNLSELSGFIPTVGSTFKILNFNSVTGTFTTVNGLTINSSEEYTVTYQPTDVLLTVVSTPAATPAHANGRTDDRYVIGSTETPRLTAALQEFNAAYAQGGRLADAGRTDGMAPRPRLERIRAMDLIKKSAKQ
jgi:hypothetical protein